MTFQTPYEAYYLYTALKSHFKGTYDYIRYMGKLRVTQQSFETRKDRWFFHKLAKHPDLKNFLIANFVVRGDVWVGDLINSNEGEEAYKSQQKKLQSLGYNFKSELSNLLTSFNENFIVKDQQHPWLLKLYFQKKVSVETLIILDSLLHFFSKWDKELENDPLWKDVRKLCDNYKPFLQYDRLHMKKLVQNAWGDADAA